MDKIITLDRTNIDHEHICCAISDKKCKDGYALKKEWLKQEFDKGYVFRRIDARAKVFIEYGPAENAWSPVIAPDYLFVNCFWVSGKYKGNGYGIELLRLALEDALAQGKSGLVTVAGARKFHFMSDTKWLLKQGFEICDSTNSGFSLLVKKIRKEAPDPTFRESVKAGVCSDKGDLVVYYSHRCPFTEFHVNTSLPETAKNRKLALKIHKLDTLEKAQSAPSPASIFSLFYQGKFLTTDLSVCMDSRFDKIMEKYHR